ncbi:MAG TPA: FtsX-like permease family protein, partial [Chitinophagaceae bacterium]|nr:FtsX-like permease family protein [Chitinophagaceae bacterium]
FSMYGFKLLHGHEASAFQNPYSVVLTKDKAIKYFGRADVVGETVTIESFAGTKRDFAITGVMEKPYRNSVTWITDDNDNQVFIATKDITYFGRNMDVWANPYIVGYLELHDGVRPEALREPMLATLKRHAPPDISANLEPYLMSLENYYLSGNNGLIRKLLYALSAIALFILLMAVINFVNMSVSRSARRMREIGIRKVLGGLKRQLVLQFLMESVLLVFIATLFALGIYALSKGLFSNMLDRELPSLLAFPYGFVVLLMSAIVVIGVLAGIYPAFVLSSFKTVESLKGKLASVKENVLLRKSLVGFQFSIATIVFVGAIIISRQVKLFFSDDLGYDKDYVVSVLVPRNWTPEGVKRMDGIRDRLATAPQVKSISLSYEVPNGNNGGVFAVYRYGGDSTAAVQAQSVLSDEYYAQVYGIPVLAGEFFGPPGNVTDSSKVVINEKMATALGWQDPHDAIGQKVMNQGNPIVFTIAGVTKNFHLGTMQQEIQPLMFYNVHALTAYRLISVKLAPGNIAGAIEGLRKKWTELLPGAPFEYTFMDETLKRLYKTEIQLQQASYVATALSFVIVLLGILGLVSLSVQKRTKEIGIRKVLGSSVRSIIGLFMKEVLATILAGGLIACPVAYLLMNSWLSDYAHRISMTPVPFIAAILLLGLLTAILVTFQTLKTALTNPIKSLRTE